jgi:hypothetical protein
MSIKQCLHRLCVIGDHAGAAAPLAREAVGCAGEKHGLIGAICAEIFEGLTEFLLSLLIFLAIAAASISPADTGPRRGCTAAPLAAPCSLTFWSLSCGPALQLIGPICRT